MAITTAQHYCAACDIHCVPKNVPLYHLLQQMIKWDVFLEHGVDWDFGVYSVINPYSTKTTNQQVTYTIVCDAGVKRQTRRRRTNRTAGKCHVT